MDEIIDFYERYDEDDRLTLDRARQVEFIVTTALLNRYIMAPHRILELGAGTGAYSFYYAQRGNPVTATDISPRHVEMIRQKIKAREDRPDLTAAVVDARDLRRYEANCFDAVLCLGPFYHLSEEQDRIKCIQQALGVLKPRGLLAVAYINKHNVVHAVMANMSRYFTREFIREMLETGTYKDAADSFLSVGYFTTPAEMESLISGFDVEIVDHAATDGITSLLRDPVNGLPDEAYDVWVRYMLENCRDRNLLGLSNHVLLLCRKN